jgi:hypothetical protein
MRNRHNAAFWKLLIWIPDQVGNDTPVIIGSSFAGTYYLFIVIVGLDPTIQWILGTLIRENEQIPIKPQRVCKKEPYTL